MSALYPPPRWKTIWSHPRYEISEEGQVRVKSGFRNAGYTLKRFWNDGYTTEPASQDAFENREGSLCVELHDYPRHTTVRLWKLMETYWPDVEWPSHWRKERKVSPVKQDNEPDRRFKLTDEQVQEIRESNLPSNKLAEMYPVCARHIRAIKQKVRRYA